MLHPVGPLPATIYWRRRAAAIGATIVALGLVGWLLVSLTGSPGATPAAQQSALGTTGSASRTSPAPTTTTTPDPTTTVPAPAAAPTTTPAPPAAPAPSPVPAPAATPAPVAVPAAPPACPDPAIGLTAQVAAASYPVGQEPVFRILVTNTSATACTRDLDAGLQQVLVYSADGATRLWSSNDCFPGKSVDVPTLTPGQAKTYSVKWSGTTSEPTCQAERTRVPAGAYTVRVTLGGLSSPPVPFTLT